MAKQRQLGLFTQEFSSEEVSQVVIVSAAVAAQLHHEGRWPPNNLTKVMGADYHYTGPSMSNFLTAIKWHLANGKPSLKFKFDGAFVSASLIQTVVDLIASIDDNTKT